LTFTAGYTEDLFVSKLFNSTRKQKSTADETIWVTGKCSTISMFWSTSSRFKITLHYLHFNVVTFGNLLH